LHHIERGRVRFLPAHQEFIDPEGGNTAMPRFMMMIKGDQPPGELPNEEMLAAMVRYNEELAKAGVLLDLSGLHPTTEGARVKFTGGKRTVVEGPFTESSEQVAGYWIIEAKSMAEAIEWAKQVPFEAGGAHGYDREDGPEGEIEIRQVFELDEFGEGAAVDRARRLEQELGQKRE
jgi:hypothetical protein